MATLIPYLNFYKEIFGGELNIELAGNSPTKDHMPEHLHNQVLHSHLKSDVIQIMATDLAPTHL